MSRKIWEPWLLAASPNQIVEFALSQGHTEIIALRHYINVAFTAEEGKVIPGTY